MRIYSKRLIAGSSVFLVISLVMTLFLFRTTVQAAVFGTKNYYLALEKQNLKDFKEELKDKYKTTYMGEYSYSCKANAKIAGDQLSSDKYLKAFADFLSRFELSVNYNANNKTPNDNFFTALFNAKYDGKKFADVDIKSADNKTIIAFPELTDKTLGIDNSKINSNVYNKFKDALMSDNDDSFTKVFGLSRDEYDDLIEKYVKDIIFNEIPNDNVIFDSKADFENIACNSIKFNIDEKVISNIYKAVAKELKNDKDVKTLIASISNQVMNSTNVGSVVGVKNLTEEQIEEGIKELCDELNKEAEGMEKVKFVYTAYFNNDGDILSRHLKNEIIDTGLKLSTYKNSESKDIFKLSYEENKKAVFELKNESKLHADNTNVGKFNLDILGKTLLEAKYEYEKDAKVGNLNAFVGEVEGKINLEQFNDEGSMNYLLGSSSNIYFNFTNKKKDDDTLLGKATVATKVDGSMMSFTLFTDIEQSNVAKITKPVVSLENSIKQTDYDKLSELYEEIIENLGNKFSDIYSSFVLGK